jgi:hypothetical protein
MSLIDQVSCRTWNLKYGVSNYREHSSGESSMGWQSSIASYSLKTFAHSIDKRHSGTI